MLYRYPALIVPFLEHLNEKDEAAKQAVKINLEVLQGIDFSSMDEGTALTCLSTLWNAVECATFSDVVDLNGRYSKGEAIVEFEKVLAEAPSKVVADFVLKVALSSEDLDELVGAFSDRTKSALREKIDNGFKEAASKEAYKLLSNYLFGRLTRKEDDDKIVEKIFERFIAEEDQSAYKTYRELAEKLGLLYPELSYQAYNTRAICLFRDAFAKEAGVNSALFDYTFLFDYPFGRTGLFPRPESVDEQLWQEFLNTGVKLFKFADYDPILYTEDATRLLIHLHFQYPGSMFWDEDMEKAIPWQIRQLYLVWLYELRNRGVGSVSYESMADKLPQKALDELIEETINFINKMLYSESLFQWSQIYMPTLMQYISRDSELMLPGGKPYEFSLVAENNPLLAPLNRLLRQQHESYQSLRGFDDSFTAVDDALSKIDESMRQRRQGCLDSRALETMTLRQQMRLALQNYEMEFICPNRDFDIYKGYGTEGKVIAAKVWDKYAQIDEDDPRESEYEKVNQGLNLSIGHLSEADREYILGLGEEYALSVPDIFYLLLSQFREKAGTDYLDFDFQRSGSSRLDGAFHNTLKHYRNPWMTLTFKDKAEREQAFKAYEELNRDFNIIWSKLSDEEKKQVLEDARLQPVFDRDKMVRAIAGEYTGTEFAPLKLDWARTAVFFALLVQFIGSKLLRRGKEHDVDSFYKKLSILIKLIKEKASGPYIIPGAKEIVSTEAAELKKNHLSYGERLLLNELESLDKEWQSLLVSLLPYCQDKDAKRHTSISGWLTDLLELMAKPVIYHFLYSGGRIKSPGVKEMLNKLEYITARINEREQISLQDAQKLFHEAFGDNALASETEKKRIIKEVFLGKFLKRLRKPPHILMFDLSGGHYKSALVRSVGGIELDELRPYSPENGDPQSAIVQTPSEHFDENGNKIYMVRVNRSIKRDASFGVELDDVRLKPVETLTALLSAMRAGSNLEDKNARLVIFNKGLCIDTIKGSLSTSGERIMEMATIWLNILLKKAFDQYPHFDTLARTDELQSRVKQGVMLQHFITNGYRNQDIYFLGGFDLTDPYIKKAHYAIGDKKNRIIAVDLDLKPESPKEANAKSSSSGTKLRKPVIDSLVRELSQLPAAKMPTREPEAHPMPPAAKFERYIHIKKIASSA